MSHLTSWVGFGREKAASDLHLEPGSPLVLRIRGELVTVGETLTSDGTQQAAKEIMGSSRWQEFLQQRSADFSHTLAGVRCRVHVYQTLHGVSLAVRLLSTFRTTLSESNLHPDLARFTKAETGLVLMCGPTGSGKSTTLAAFVEEINQSRRGNIVTVESPIEYHFKNRKSFIRQREVNHHTPSFEQAIVDSMREDPDVLVIGEMRTPDVMRLTLNAAETGHLVFSTIHSSSCAEAITRLCMSFPAELQSSISNQVADCLVGVICQRLVYYPQYKIRVPHCEILVANSAVKSVIRAGTFSKIPNAIQTGGDEGMWTFDRYKRWAEQNTNWLIPSTKPIEVIEERAISEAPVSKPQQKYKVSTPELDARPEPKAVEIAATDDDLDDLIQQMIDPKKKK